MLEHKVIIFNRTEKIKSFKTKNKKLNFSSKKAKCKATTKYSLPIGNLLTYQLKDTEYGQLKLGLDTITLAKIKA